MGVDITEFRVYLIPNYNSWTHVVACWSRCATHMGPKTNIASYYIPSQSSIT